MSYICVVVSHGRLDVCRTYVSCCMVVWMYVVHMCRCVAWSSKYMSYICVVLHGRLDVCRTCVVVLHGRPDVCRTYVSLCYMVV